MTATAENAKNIAQKAIDLATQFAKEWDNQVSDYKKSINNLTIKSPLELVIHLTAVISARNDFGVRFDQLILQLDEEGKALISKNDDKGIVISEITHAMEEVFSISKALDLDFKVDGNIRGRLGETRFSINSACVTIFESWKYLYENDSSTEKIRQKKAAELKQAADNARSDYYSKQNEIDRKNLSLDEQKSAELSQTLSEFKQYRNNLINACHEEAGNSIAEKERTIESLSNELADARLKLMSIGIIHFVQKNEAQKSILTLENKIKALESEKNSIKSEINNQFEAIDYDVFTNYQYAKKILDCKYEHIKSTRRPDEMLSESQRMKRETIELILEILSKESPSRENLLAELPVDNTKYFSVAIAELEHDNKISIQRCGRDTFYYLYEDDEKINISPDFIVTYDAVKNYRKSLIDKFKYDVKVAYDLLHFYAKYKDINTFTHPQFLSEYTKQNHIQVTNCQEHFDYYMYWTEYKASNGITSCKLTQKGINLMNEIGYFTFPQSFNWYKTEEDMKLFNEIISDSDDN